MKRTSLSAVLCALLCAGILLVTGCAAKSQVFTGTAKGYGGEIKVDLTVADGKITKVAIAGDKETPGVGERAVQQLPDAILKAQTYDVDVVAGATISSTSIKKAAKAAMESAGLLQTASPCNGDGQITLESINEFLNNSADMGEGSIANVVAVIPIQHINGPREEHDFYAFVNFKYKARNYVKYQVTYLSCTCRSADVNYWSTAYVELTLPKSGKLDDSTIRYLSFDYDSEGHYLAGFWGDSNPTPAGADYDDFKREYIPFFVGKDYAYIKTLSTSDDIDPALYTAGEGRANLTLDTFTGSSVSTNNMIRMLNALYEYHGSDEFFAQE